MPRRSPAAAIIRVARAGRLVAGLVGVALAALLPAAAQASSQFTLDSRADTTGPIVTEASGTGYVAWEHPAASNSEPPVVLFCKIPRGATCTAPITLPLPAGSYEEIVQPFPVLGSTPGVVYVVGPRYVKAEVTLIWTSTDGGEKFSAPKKVPGGDPGKTGVGDVLLDPNTPSGITPGEDYFGMVGSNPGLAFGFTANEITSGSTSFTFEHPGEGGVASSTLGYVNEAFTDSFTHEQVHPEIVAYYNESTPYEVFFYRYYAKGGNVDGEETGWEGPIKVGDGYEPRLAGGPDGLFLLSTDLAPGEPAEEQPSVVDVRRFNEETHTFGPPTEVAKIPTSAGTLHTSGDIFENPETGVLYVAQPVESEGAYVMRLWESSDGGQTFHGEREIATIGAAYEGIPRLAVAADCQGWLTFEDGGGLEVAEVGAPPYPCLTGPPAVSSGSSSSSGSGAGGSSAGSKPPPPPTRVVIAAHKFGDLLLQLTAPSACTAPSSDLSLTLEGLPQGGKGLANYKVDHVAFYIDGGSKRKITVGKPGDRHHETIYEPQHQSNGLPSTFTFLPSGVGAHAGSNSVLVKVTLVTHTGQGKHRKTVRTTKTLTSTFEVC